MTQDPLFEVREMARSIPETTVEWTTTIPLEVVRLERGGLGHADLFTKALKRMRTFSESMGVPVGSAEDAVWKMFAEKSPLLGIWVAHRGGCVEAHLHADIRPWNGVNVVWIAQARVDDPTLFRAGHIDTILQEIMTWGKSLNDAFPQLSIQDMVFNTFRDAKVWQRRFGFIPQSTILTRKLL